MIEWGDHAEGQQNLKCRSFSRLTDIFNRAAMGNGNLQCKQIEDWEISAIENDDGGDLLHRGVSTICS
jgi:hypothetical protein